MLFRSGHSVHDDLLCDVLRSICDESTVDCRLEVSSISLPTAANAVWLPQEAPAFWTLGLSLAHSALSFM